MCNTLFDKLKLCSCDTDGIRPLTNYWKLRRWTTGMAVIGQCYSPELWNIKMDQKNWSPNYQEALKVMENAQEFYQKTIDELLVEAVNNQDELFDFEYSPESGDMLELSFVLSAGDRQRIHVRLSYDESWSIDGRGPLDRLNEQNFPEFATGKLEGSNIIAEGNFPYKGFEFN